jgi:hypothetical protein
MFASTDTIADSDEPSLAQAITIIQLFSSYYMTKKTKSRQRRLVKLVIAK